MIEVYNDEYFMKQAMQEAQKAYEMDEVPIGAVVVSEKRIIARAHNQVQMLNDVTAHAEILAITSASNFLGNKYLHGCTLYVTIEPCTMCGGALRWSQIDKVIYGASDDKGGFMRFGKEFLHPKTKLEYGIMEEEIRAIMRTYFSSKRD